MSPRREAAQTLADVAAAYIVNAQTRAVLRDTSDRAQRMVLHDPLTGLPNRVLFLERLDHAVLSQSPVRTYGGGALR